jgi:GxxExxY protein
MELDLRGVRAKGQCSFPVMYQGRLAGEYFPDILFEDVLLVEVKCVDSFGSERTAQCINYLRASGLTLCLLVNFQRPNVQWKRIVHGFREDPRSSAFISG